MITTTTPPASEPIDVAALKRQCRILSDDEDVELEGFIKTARAQVEAYLRKRLITQTVEILTDGFGRDVLRLPIGPIQSVESLEYINAAGTWVTLATDQYRLVESCNPPVLAPEYGKSWPVPRLIAANVKITLVVGYGDAGSDVDPAVLGAVRLLAAHLYENREATNGGQNIGELPFGVTSQLSPHRLWL